MKTPLYRSRSAISSSQNTLRRLTESPVTISGRNYPAVFTAGGGGRHVFVLPAVKLLPSRFASGDTALACSPLHNMLTALYLI